MQENLPLCWGRYAGLTGDWYITYGIYTSEGWTGFVNLKNVDPREMLFNLMEEIVEVKVVLNMSLSLY